MDFLRRLFGGGRAALPVQPGDKTGLYFFVRPAGCQEVVRVRIDANNDPSLADDGTYFVYKTVRGSTYKCTRSAELRVYFDSRRNLSSTEVEGGELVSQEVYEAWLASPENV